LPHKEQKILSDKRDKQVMVPSKAWDAFL